MSLFNRFQSFDVYTKPVDDCRVKTGFGGLITLISFIVILFLFFAELLSFFSIEVVELLYVDSSSPDQRVDIHFDISFYKISCDFISIDAMGLSSASQDAIEDDIFKQRLDSTGKKMDGSQPEKQNIDTNKTDPQPDVKNKSIENPECGSCYGAIRGCCNTCDEVKEAYRIRGWQIENPADIQQCKNDFWINKLVETKGQGCRVYGKVQVGKVGGNFHIAPGTSTTQQTSHYHDFHSLSPSNFDTSHIINHFSFGKPYPGKTYPLNGIESVSNKAGIMYSYFTKVVPTNYVYSVTKKRDVEMSHQISVTRTMKDILAGAGGIPGIFFQYEFSPLMVQYEEKQRPLSNFLVSLCAIVGGVFTVAGLVDFFIYSGSRALQRKLSAGKFR